MVPGYVGTLHMVQAPRYQGNKSLGLAGTAGPYRAEVWA